MSPKAKEKVIYEQLTFAKDSDFRSWLHENHDKSDGVWLVFGKTNELITLSYDEALRHALCYGWIDGQIKRIDDVKYIRKFTPRRKRSVWSKRNKEIAAELKKMNLMMPSGYEAIARAKEEGTWEPQARETITDNHVLILTDKIKDRQPAFYNFIKMSPSVKRTYARFYMDTKKEETKIRRLEKIIDRLNENLKPM